MLSPQTITATLLGLAALLALTTAVLWLYRVTPRWAPARAILQGALQLAAISLILSGVIQHPALVGCALLVMFSVAASTSTKRLGWNWHNLRIVAAAMAAGVGAALGIIFITGAMEFSGRYLLATGGIVIGNAMTIATLTGRNLKAALISQWEQVEGWLALGATARQATGEIARQAVGSAMIPTTDQTKTTGLVTLPGAFVGAIFGGVSPLEAGRFQIVVLAAVLASGAITGVIVAHFFSPVKRKPKLDTKS